jgi:hypothetical protein
LRLQKSWEATVDEITAELCKQKAEECRELAGSLAEPNHKAAMLRFAQAWMRLAVYRAWNDMDRAEREEEEKQVA